MSTTVWVILSVAGLLVGFLAGYGRRRRRASAASERGAASSRGSPRASHPATRSRTDDAPAEPGQPPPGKQDPDDGVVVDAAFGVPRHRASAAAAPEGKVIDLRRPSADAATTGDPDVSADGLPRTSATRSRVDSTAASEARTAGPMTVTDTPAPHDPAPEQPTEAASDTSGRDTPGTAGVPSADPASPSPAGGDAETGGEPGADVIDLRDRVRVAVPLHNLQFVRGIGPGVDLALRRQGITTLADLAGLDRAGIERVAATIDGLSAKQLRTRRGRAREMLAAAESATVAAPPDTTALRLVRGIGPTMARWLETHDITDLETLAALDRDQVDRLEAQLVDHPGRIRAERWVKQARALLAAE